MLKRITWLALLCFSLQFAPSCAEEEEPPVEKSGFAKVYDEVIESGCSCHFTQTHESKLFLGDEQAAYDNLVGIAAGGTGCINQGTRVVAGDSAGSIFYQKVIADDTNRCGSRMPLGGELSAAQQELIRAWIDDGAPRN